MSKYRNRATYGGKDIPANVTVQEPAVYIDTDTSTATPLGFRGINAQTGTSYTPVLSDIGKLVTLTNGSAITLTLPQDSDAAFPIGTRLTFAQLGAGLVSVAAGSGATVNNNYTAAFGGQYAVTYAVKRAANTWLVFGDYATS